MSLTISMFAVALTALIVVVLVRAPQAAGKQAFILSGISAIWWLFCVFLRAATPDLSVKILYCELAWFGIIGTPLFWTAGFLSYAGIKHMSKPADLKAIMVASVFAGVMALTNDWHHWIYTGIINSERPTFTHGWLFFVLTAVCYAFMTTACVVAIGMMRRVSDIHRLQIAGIIAATMMPLGSNIAFNLFGFRIFNDDPTPYAFGATALIMLLIRVRGKLFIAPPIARDVIFTVLPDPVMVFDNSGRILEANPAAMRLSVMSDQPIGGILRTGNALMDALPRSSIRSGVIELQSTTGNLHFFEITRQPLAHWGRKDNLMVVLRDVTERENARKRLAATTRDLELKLEENMQLQSRLRDEAARDHLTGLHNRRHASATVPAYLSNQLPGTQAAFIVLDIDHFKQVNDNLGHDAGDKLLVRFAQILQQGLGANDLIFRFGGEEFLAVLPDSGREEALALCAAWRSKLANQDQPVFPGVDVTFSAGIAIAPEAGRTLEACTKAADVALYRAKISGRNRDVVWGEHLAGLSNDAMEAHSAAKSSRNNDDQAA